MKIIFNLLLASALAGTALAGAYAAAWYIEKGLLDYQLDERARRPIRVENPDRARAVSGDGPHSAPE